MTTTAHPRPRAAKSRVGSSAAAASIAGASSPASKGRPAAPPSEPAALSAIERVRLARNPSRPQTLDYVEHLVRDFFEIHGDRRFADDGAIVAGLGYLGRRAVAIVGHQRGRSTQERIRRNFGKPHPEGYRKAARMYDLAGRMGLPLITFIDTQGAEPGLGAEERGQAEAIAANLELMMRLEVPIIGCVIGEGGSGGALALGVANVVLMQENACYSVITPEGCAAILWREGGPERVADAAEALKLSAPDLLRLGVADEVVPEPPGGAHQEPRHAAEALGRAIERYLARLLRLSPIRLREEREKKFAAMGAAFIADRGAEDRRPLG
ncbi:MAG TPA: acetyl-CoA carboxylase carboxyltransferase subunit alpha [Candidatus Binataceae bacterium]|nr:acetyl-CoA carboxylase carboxyltransferase subunit alpha [Candidatus Binataceae bacterium]